MDRAACIVCAEPATEATISPTMRTLRGFLIGLMLAALAPAIAAAQVVVSFHGHEGARVRGGFLYFPHAYVSFSGTVQATGERVDEAWGFTAASPGPQLLFVSGPGVLSPPDARYVSEAVDYMSVTISDETWFAMHARLDDWRTGPGSRYNLNRRNCISFVAEMARMAGLQTPREDTRSPNGFLKQMVALNPPPAVVTVAEGP